MAYNNQNRLSSYSAAGSNLGSNVSRSNPQMLASVSTQTLLNALHTTYFANTPYQLDSSTSLVVNTWHSTAFSGPEGEPGGIIDQDLAKRVWEHARRRAEDGCVILGSLHESTPSLLTPFISALPISIPDIFFTALDAVRPFLTSATPQNGSLARHSSLATTFNLALDGSLSGASIKLSTSGIDVKNGLLNIAQQQGYRAFDVFYYLLSSASSAGEREFLGLKNPSSYALLKRSGTYNPPSYLPTADDTAAAEEWRSALKVIGITGQARRDLFSVLASLLRLGDSIGYLVEDEELDEICEDAAGLMGLEPQAFSGSYDPENRNLLVAGVYEALVDWVMSKANQSISADFGHDKTRKSSMSSMGDGALTPVTGDSDDTASITVLEIPSPELGKAVALRNIFNDSEGINLEMKEDGVPVTPAGHSVVSEMQSAVTAKEPDLGILTGHAGREKEVDRERREVALDRFGQHCEDNTFIKKLLYPVRDQGITLGSCGRFDLSNLVGSSRVWFQLCLHPTDEAPEKLVANSQPWSAGSPSRQLRSWRLPEWANRRNRQLDFTADFDLEEFCNRYSRLGCQDGREGIETFSMERGWSNGEIVIGTERVWIREGAWWEAESMLDIMGTEQENAGNDGLQGQNPQFNNSFYGTGPFADNASFQESRDNLAGGLQRNQSSATFGQQSIHGGKSLAPTAAMTMQTVAGGDYGLGYKGDTKQPQALVEGLDPELADPKAIHEKQMTTTRRIWVAFVWALTFWIPSFTLRFIGRMKRPDVRMAWREKIVLVALIALFNGIICFYIIGFGHLLCPMYDKVWTNTEVGYHQGSNDAYVSVAGRVYDITKFWRINHSGLQGKPVTEAQMEPLLGQNLDSLFPVPLSVGCPALVKDDHLAFIVNQSAVPPNTVGAFSHASGALGTPNSDLTNPNWYSANFLPTMKQYYKGDLVYHKDKVQATGTNQQYQWVVLNGSVYDLSSYFYSQSVQEGYQAYHFLDPQVEQMVQSNPGSDITDDYMKWARGNSTGAIWNSQCLNNVFYVGKLDPRDSARCKVNDYILLAVTIVICAVILIKFLSALQLGSKKRPAQQDKFVICQVPAYTEGEDQLRKSLDSLTALAYDNKRKLICVVCDGMIVGGGNDRPTPKIVLDILGVDPKIDPPALPFLSVGEGSNKLNYGKVYSGLYEYEGNVVPYIVIVKVGKESEQTKSKPGNRGKRDSQIMLMRFLNRVHHRSPMSPLELEMFHQINNIIGVDPELYEYLFMIDADTTVKEDALNRLVAACAHDAKIAGICGETSLENEEQSWTTMIQVYEYYISHHLTKAFESLFGSVTCLPGCFTMYRLRTIDKGKPLIISDKIIDDYTINNVDTLHKKNLLSLGEDRYLTTLMTKYFPAMKYKFIPDAYAKTAAPDSWSVLVSQRRRWINSTIHNLAELVLLKDLCGFCCFSMRFVVFIDLVGTIILPATCVYIGYLIYEVASGSGAFPLLSIIIIACVYGLQAIIFLIKRQWQHIGWMIIYLLAFPIYSFVLPIYSFWKQDDFSWGSTRIVIGEKGSKQVVAMDDEGFDPRSIPLQAWDDYATVNNLPGRRGMAAGSEKYYDDPGQGYEMDEIRSMYSAKPASTVLTGFKSQAQPGAMSGYYMPPRSPAPFAGPQARPSMPNRQSMYSNFSGRYTDNPSPGFHNGRSSEVMMGGPATNYAPSMMTGQMPQHRSPYMSPGPGMSSTDNLMSPAFNRSGRSATPLGFQSMSQTHSRQGSVSNLLAHNQSVPNFQAHQSGQPEVSDAQITDAIQQCLAVVDLDSVTKKQLKALTEQRLQVSLSPERRQWLDSAIDIELANMN